MINDDAIDRSESQHLKDRLSPEQALLKHPHLSVQTCLGWFGGKLPRIGAGICINSFDIVHLLDIVHLDVQNHRHLSADLTWYGKHVSFMNCIHFIDRASDMLYRILYRILMIVNVIFSTLDGPSAGMGYSDPALPPLAMG